MLQTLILRKTKPVSAGKLAVTKLDYKNKNGHMSTNKRICRSYKIQILFKEQQKYHSDKPTVTKLCLDYGLVVGFHDTGLAVGLL